MYLLRIKDGPIWMTRMHGLPEEIEEVVAPVYRGNPDCRVYLFDFGTPLPAARPLAVLKTYDPEDSNHVIFYVQTLSGADLFDFGFLVQEALTP